MHKLSVFAAALLLSSGAAFAQTNYDKRQADQLDWIEEGRRSGEITWREGRRLRADQRRISALERRFLADGHIDAEERRVLRAAQNAAGERIRDESVDARRRPRGLPRFGR